MLLVQLPSFLPALLADSGQGNPGLSLGGRSACRVLCHQLPCGSAWAAGWAWVPISLQSSVLQGGWSLARPADQLCTAPTLGARILGETPQALTLTGFLLPSHTH